MCMEQELVILLYETSCWSNTTRRKLDRCSITFIELKEKTHFDTSRNHNFSSQQPTPRSSSNLDGAKCQGINESDILAHTQRN